MKKKREPVAGFMIMALAFNLLQRLDFIFCHLPINPRRARHISEYFANFKNGVPTNQTLIQHIVDGFDSIRDQILHLQNTSDSDPHLIPKRSRTHQALATLRQKMPELKLMSSVVSAPPNIRSRFRNRTANNQKKVKPPISISQIVNPLLPRRDMASSMWKWKWCPLYYRRNNDPLKFIGLGPEEQDFQIKATLNHICELMDRFIEMVTGNHRRPLTLNRLIHPIKSNRVRTVFFNQYFKGSPINKIEIICCDKPRDHSLVLKLLSLDFAERKSFLFMMETLIFNVMYYVATDREQEMNAINVGLKFSEEVYGHYVRRSRFKIQIMFNHRVLSPDSIRLMNDQMQFMFEGQYPNRMSFRDFDTNPAERLLISALLHVFNLDGRCSVIRGDEVGLYVQALCCYWDLRSAYFIRGGIRGMSSENGADTFAFVDQKFDDIFENIQFMDKALIAVLGVSPEYLPFRLPSKE